MRIQDKNSNNHIFSLKKIAIFLFSLLFIYIPIFAQNGIPIDVLQDDPYFRSGSADEAIESSESEQEKSTEETIESKESSLVNSTANDNSQNSADETNDSTEISSSEDDKSNQINIPAPIEMKEDIVDAKIDIAIGYMGFYTYEIEPDGIATYFDMNNFYNINPYGASARIEFMTLPAIFGVNGIGFNTTWSPMKKTSTYYTLKTNLITANLFFAHKVRFPNTRLMFEWHIGGGGMLFVLPTYTFETGYEPKPYNWIYPEAFAGIAFQIYFTRHWGLDLNIDVVYPFLVEVMFPVAQVTFSSGWHF